MEWWILLSGSLFLLLAVFIAGVPMFVAFLLLNLAGVLFLMGAAGFSLIANSIFATTNLSALAAIPLFILMGEVLFRAGSIDLMMNSIDKLIGRIKGRQYAMAVLISAIFGALSGSAMGVAAMMARSLYPGMIARGYDSRLSTGTILAGASLAPIIPPSVAVVILATLADISIAQLLIAGILPGLVLALCFLIYIFVRIKLDPALAPPPADNEGGNATFGEQVVAVLQLLPFGIIIFFVMGFILLGIATPSEAAATGVFGSLITAAYFRKLNWRMFSESLSSAAFVTSLILIIMASSNMFAQLLAFTGSARQLAVLVTSLDVSPMLLLFMTMGIVFVLCMFIDQTALMLVLVPIYTPMVAALGFDPLWYWTLMLVNLVVGGITPPFGYTMFAFKGGAPDVPIREVYAATWPYVGIFVLVMLLVAMFPPLATYLPGLLH